MHVRSTKDLIPIFSSVNSCVKNLRVYTSKFNSFNVKNIDFFKWSDWLFGSLVGAFNFALLIIAVFLVSYSLHMKNPIQSVVSKNVSCSK